MSLPQPFGRYVLAMPLGEGGVGYVHLAVTERGTPCVVKRLFPEALQDAEVRTRFQREAMLSVALDHPNIVRTLDCGAHEGEPYIAQEFLDGRDLQWFLSAEEAALPPAAVAFVAHQVLEGLECLHAFRDRGWVHRDVTPSNIRITKAGEVKLLDFGLAKDRMATRLTKPGKVMGKLAYMAPEQLSAKQVDGRADLYPVAVVMWELLARRRLAETLVTPEGFAGSPAEHLLKGQAPDVREYREDVPSSLAEVVARGLEKDRDRRYGSAYDMAQALLPWVREGRKQLLALVQRVLPQPLQEQAREDAIAEARAHIGKRKEPSSAFATVPVRPRRSRSRLVGAALAAVGLGAVVWLLARFPRSPVQHVEQEHAEPATIVPPAEHEAQASLAEDPPVSSPDPIADAEPAPARVETVKPAAARLPRAAPLPRAASQQPAQGEAQPEAAAELPTGASALEQARAAFSAGDYERAARTARAAGDGGAPADGLLGAALFKLKRFAEAEQAFARALAQDPNNASLTRQLGAARHHARAAGGGGAEP